MLVKAGSGLAGPAAADSAGVPPEVATQTLVAPLDDDAALDQVFKEHGPRIAAVILEPMPANYGLLSPRRAWLEKIMTLAKANGSLVIFDEGFRVPGRLGRHGRAPRHDARPRDLRQSVGRRSGRRGLRRSRRSDEHRRARRSRVPAGTLSANPLAMRTGYATLKKMRDVNGWQTLEDRTQSFVKGLNEILPAANLTATSLGSVFWIHPKVEKPIRALKDLPPGMGDRYKPFFPRLLKRGVYRRRAVYEVGFLTLAHTDDVLRENPGASARGGP